MNEQRPSKELRAAFDTFCAENCSPGAMTSDFYWRLFQAGARAAHEPPEAHEELIRRLRNFGQAYPYEVFPSLTAEERKQVGGNLISRISAAMGRHCSTIMGEAADALERAPSPPPDVQRDAERYRWMRERYIAFEFSFNQAAHRISRPIGDSLDGMIDHYMGTPSTKEAATGHDNTNTAVDRPSAITAGEAAASDGDSACPVVSPSRAQVALRAIYDATAEDGLHENKALFQVAQEGLGYSIATADETSGGNS